VCGTSEVERGGASITIKVVRGPAAPKGLRNGNLGYVFYASVYRKL
jgi:hypothetical protein